MKLLVLLGLAALGAWLFVHYDLIVFFQDKNRLIAFIDSFGPLSVVVFIGLQILQVLFAPVPGEVTGFIGGYIYGSVLGTVFSTIGLTVGSWLAFALARWFGLPFVERVVSAEVLKKYDYFMEHQGKLVSFILFLIPGFPKDALCYVIGLSHMKTVTFLVVSTLGRLLGTAMLSVSGDLARSNRHEALWGLGIISLVFIIVAYFYRDRWLNRLRRKKKTAPADSSGIIPQKTGNISPDGGPREGKGGS
ncbi:MAG TPA: TVP38/TMEM64 family protein [Syntrophales bacterium]|nr:TVP38/TMEM64 family protein [Syntrophales bacterium]